LKTPLENAKKNLAVHNRHLRYAAVKQLLQQNI